MNILYEDLSKRRLWVDGESTLTKEALYDKILSASDVEQCIIHDFDSEITNYEKLKGIKFKYKKVPNTDFDTRFFIPDRYFSIDLEEYFFKRIKQRTPNYNGLSIEEKEKRIIRVLDELDKYQQLFLSDVLRLGLFIVDTFKDNGVVWGSGRGSSCASYLLYLIELHDVDSVKYDLTIDEFLRDV